MAAKVTSDGRIVLWQGASLWAFDVLPQEAPRPNRLHAHHAFQFTVATGGTAIIRREDGLLVGPVVLIAPDHPHAIESEGRIALLFGELESHARAGLRRLLSGRSAASLGPRP